MAANETGPLPSHGDTSLVIIDADNRNIKKKRLHTAGGRERKRDSHILKKSIDRFNRTKFSYDINALEEKECGPGDYQIPFLTGNKGVPYSHIKTPPHYSFSRTGLNLAHTQSVTS